MERIRRDTTRRSAICSYFRVRYVDCRQLFGRFVGEYHRVCTGVDCLILYISVLSEDIRTEYHVFIILEHEFLRVQKMDVRMVCIDEIVSVGLYGRPQFTAAVRPGVEDAVVVNGLEISLVAGEICEVWGKRSGILDYH